jgi:PAS domain S-box-containing protein
MSQSRPKTKVAAVVLLAGVLPGLLSFTSHLVIGDARLVREPLHEGLELTGSCIAVAVAMLLLLRLKRGIASPHLRCVVAALVGMGIIDGVHSLVHFDVASSWSRHVATFLGGTITALVWLPQPPAVARRCRLLVPIVATAALAFAVAIWWWPERLPTTWAEGQYTGLVIALNALGGLGFLAAATFFARGYLREPNSEELVFASYTLLFGTASLFYGVSHAWAADWWVWHAARLLAYAVVLGSAYDVVVALYEDQGRLTQELGSRVRERTAELATANVGLRETQNWLEQAERLGKVGGWSFDIETGQQTWTGAVYDIHELERTDHPTVEEGINFYTPASRPVISRAVRRAIEHGEPFDLELEILTAKGNLRSVHAIGRADLARRRVSGFFQDITERKRAESALREAERSQTVLLERLNEAQRTAMVGSWEWDMQTNEVWWSAETYRLFGVDPSEFVPSFEANARFIHPDDLGTYGEAFEHSLKTGEPLNFECRLVAKDGATRHCHARATLIVDDAAKPSRFVGTLADVTERKRAEEVLRASEKRFATIFRANPAAIAMSRVDTGQLVDVNDAWEALTGYSHAEVVGRTPFELSLWVHPEERNRLIRMTPEQGAEEGEVTFRRKSGDTRVVLMSAEVVDVAGGRYLLTMAQDITERKRAEQALLMKNLVFDASIAANSIADVGGLITEVNPAFLRIWGVPGKDEAVGKAISGFLQNEDEAAGIVTALQTAGDWAGDYTAKRADGSVFVAHGLATVLRNGAGEVVGYQSSVLDVTEQRRAEAEVRGLNEHLEQRVLERTAQLEASNKELEAFSYSVSHDLRAPLRAIDGFGRILVEDYEDRLDPEGRRLLGVISSETRRMGQLIDDLLAFSRMGRQKMDSAMIDVAALARAVFEDQSVQVPDRALRLEVKPLPAARGDHAMIRVVLANLISNAIKFTAPRDVALIEVGGRESDGETVYWVKDNGVGFDARYADKLFGVFQRLHAKDEFDGTGVGLALAQRVIHRHGGRIWAEGIVNEGAVFSFSLPDRSGERR